MSPLARFARDADPSGETAGDGESLGVDGALQLSHLGQRTWKLIMRPTGRLEWSASGAFTATAPWTSYSLVLRRIT